MDPPPHPPPPLSSSLPSSSYLSVCLPFILRRSFCATLLFSLVFNLVFTISSTCYYIVFISSTMIEKMLQKKKKIARESYECKSKLNIAPHPLFSCLFPFSFLVVNGSVAYAINHVSVSLSLSLTHTHTCNVWWM